MNAEQKKKHQRSAIKMLKVHSQMSMFASNCQKLLTNLDDLRTFGTNVTLSGKHLMKILMTVNSGNSCWETYGKCAECAPF